MNEITFITNAARTALSSKKAAGARSKAAADFVAAKTDAERQAVVDEHGAGKVRRGLRQFATKAFGKDEEVAANFLWLRDLIDIDGEVEAVAADDKDVVRQDSAA